MTWLRIIQAGSNEEVDNSVSTVKKFYTMGSTTVAVRTVSGTEEVLNWVLGDHYGAKRSTPGAQHRGPGSASITANEDGSWNSEIKYTAFGEVRASSGLTPTEYRYNNQLNQNSLGLYFYVARWYDSELAHFIQADQTIPGIANAKA
jgi:RHS repeat-associated protein